MEYNKYGLHIKYRMSCVDNDKRNIMANHRGAVLAEHRGHGFYWMEDNQAPQDVREKYIRPIVEKFEQHGHLESIVTSVNNVPYIPGAEAALIDITFYIKGGPNGTPRLQTKFHVFKSWDKDGNEVDVIL